MMNYFSDLFMIFFNAREEISQEANAFYCLQRSGSASENQDSPRNMACSGYFSFHLP
ncbi:hypothetical protein [uncultured Chryseobacterium sp.]|uniref:hypothetical protein n=1 Tax=uncultured Chryseobacterium sp. TaxID=259322 RepID=UPI0025850FA7|nr:hypothetical protein [uncultured Chryseobacterium sp.]